MCATSAHTYIWTHTSEGDSNGENETAARATNVASNESATRAQSESRARARAHTLPAGNTGSSRAGIEMPRADACSADLIQSVAGLPVTLLHSALGQHRLCWHGTTDTIYAVIMRRRQSDLSAEQNTHTRPAGGRWVLASTHCGSYACIREHLVCIWLECVCVCGAGYVLDRRVIYIQKTYKKRLQGSA